MDNQYSVSALDAEFTRQLINSAGFRQRQRDNVTYYNSNVFYAPKAGENKPVRNVGVNLLKMFADQNIHYTSGFPTIKKPAGGTDLETRETASLIEKIILSTWRSNGGKMLQRKWASDGTLMAEATALIEFDYKGRRPKIKRLDPRYCHYQYSNEVDNEVVAFWYAVPMTKEAIKAKWGVEPTKTGIASAQITLDGNAVPVDGVERFYVIMRLDKTTRVVWAGEHYLEEPHNHQWPVIPVEVAKPFDTGMADSRGGFFIDPLIDLQAEFNETIRRRANIIRKLSNPAIWGRGIMANQFDEVKAALEGSGGFVGLKQNGELGFLQLQETAVLDNHLKDILDNMKAISGFNNAALGIPMGANTSASAVGLYFQGTQKAILNQWIAWQSFYEAINEKICLAYQIFGKTGEDFTLYGTSLTGSVSMVDGGDGNMKPQYQAGGYQVKFTKEQLGQDFCTEVIAPDVTPKDETATKQLALNAVQTGFLPRVRAYEMFGDTDPESTLDLLAQEREDPRLHPEVLQQTAQAMSTMAGAGEAGAETPGEAPEPGTAPLPGETATAPGAPINVG